MLTDLEICKKIAEIEGYTTKAHEGYDCCAVDGNDVIRFIPFDPINNDGHCFRLMVKYKITVEFTRYYEHLKSASTKAYYDDKADNGYGAYIRDIKPNKAICLAIIEAYKQC